MTFMTMMPGQDLTDDIDEQTQDGGDIAGNLRSALVGRVGIDTVDSQNFLTEQKDYTLLKQHHQIHQSYG